MEDHRAWLVEGEREVVFPSSDEIPVIGHNTLITILAMSEVGIEDTCNLVELTLEELNLSGSPIRLCCLACAFFTLLVFVLSEASRNYSQTDKM